MISLQVHVCEQHMPWRWKWLEDVAKLTHVMMKELIAHETYIESCDQGGEDQDVTWLDGPVASVEDKLSDDLAPID